MSLLDRLRSKRQEEAAAERLAVVVPATPAGSASGMAIPPRPMVQKLSGAEPPLWINAGQTFTIGELTIPDGMVYVGSSRGQGNRSRDPSLIDPALPVNVDRPDWAGAYLPYYPAYREIPPSCRGAYLLWLAGGRTRPDIGIGYVFIYFYGLERRALVDAARNSLFRAELSLIRAEVQRLLDLYGGANPSFRQYASSFLGLLDIQGHANPGAALTPPAFGEDRWRVPPSLRLAISQFAHYGQPVPAEWALVWSQFRSERWPKTPARRLPDAYAQLFAIRYRAQCGEGIVPAKGWQPLRVEYRPASAVLQPVTQTIGTIHDAFDDSAGVAAIGRLAEDVSEDLAGLSKWRKRNPDLPLSAVSALAVMPEELLGRIEGESLALLQWLQEQLGGQEIATVPFAGLAAHWPTGSFTKTEAAQLARALEILGFGIEPDVRLGGPVPRGPDSVALFHLRYGDVEPVRASLTTAMVMAQLAIGVATADGELSRRERVTLVDHVAGHLGLTAGEQDRIEAHWAWLATRTVKPAAMRARMKDLTQVQREAVGDLIIAVAAADGAVSAGETALVQRVFGMLELDADAALHRLFDASAGSLPTTGSATTREPGPAAGFSLNKEAIEAKIAQSAVAAAMIASVFNEEDAEVQRFEPVANEPSPVVDSERHLDVLLAELATREMWSRAAFEALCAAQSVLPLAALEALNERAMDACDEPLIEGDDPLRINEYALEALTA